MNQDASNNDWNRIQRAIAKLGVEFELAWEKDNQNRIEDFLPSVNTLLESCGLDANQSGLMDQVIGALIKLEMELRLDSNQKFDRFEYYRRFPDFVTAIDEAIEHFEKLDSDSKQLLVTVSMPELSEAEDAGDWIIVEHGSSFLPQELGPYQQIIKIGAGGFGVVCSAVDSRSGTKVALKFPRKNQLSNGAALKLFLEEAKRTRNLDHPGIVKTLSVERIDGYLVIVMQLIEGSDLKAWMKANRTPREVAELVALIAEALAYANRQGVVHRDLKPSNILMDREGRPYITDFGLALHESVQLSLPNQRCGTAPYMSPQQVAGLTRNLDGRDDIWSLGVVLYELLARKRPFRGNTAKDLFEQIETRDPKPIRQIVSSIDKELERICLRCLARQARDRYLTGDDLAEDLRLWLGQPATKELPTGEAAVFVPKGLRSYGAEDSDFFLDLLPGPRDRDNIPASVRFWSSRICEPVAEENRVPVGVIYGPSGSGKSSFVKAGLLPLVNHQVEEIYVESTQADTEVRLIKQLRRLFPSIPSEFSLPEILRGLSHGEWGADGRKLLIVLDQFEQRLSQADDYSQSQLAKALRHCDGEHLQCLLLIRDDFWLALTRFCDALEMDLLEGQNSQDIDLFDRAHAKKVLIKLGRAYGRLPEETVELTHAQKSFLEQAIDQLAVGNYIICVRLTLFAEMFKSRDWTVVELKSVGGAFGVGERFLEETFGPGSWSKRYQMQGDSAKAILGALLPETGSDIRGSMQPEAALKSAAKFVHRPDRFRDLIKTLDNELRLITRTDPDESGEVADSNKWAVVQYQLTHDYLVPSVRDWLETDLKKTRRGRARLRLRELAAGVVEGQRPKNLPTNLEWLTWQAYFFRTNLAGTERIVMSCGRRNFLFSFAVVAAVIVIVAIVALRDRANRITIGAVGALVGLNFDQAIKNIEKLQQNKNTALSELGKYEFVVGEKKRKACLGLYALGASKRAEYQKDIIDNVLRSDCGPEELKASIGVLNRYADSDDWRSGLVEFVQDSKNESKNRFRAAVSLALVAGKTMDKEFWTSQAGLIGDSLVREPVATHKKWIALLGPIGRSLEKKFSEMFAKTEDRGRAMVLASAIYSFANVDKKQCAGDFVEFLFSSNDAQFNAVLSTYETNSDEASLIAAIKNKSNIESDHAITSKAIALLRLNHPEEFKALLRSCNSPRIRSLAVIKANNQRIQFSTAQRLLTEAVPADLDSACYRQAVLMILAGFAKDMFDETEIAQLVELAQKTCESDRDAGCFAAGELIARRLGGDYYRWRKTRHAANQGGRLGSVYINSMLQPFSIITVVDPQPYELAVSMYETTNVEFNNVVKGANISSRPECPHLFSKLQHIFQYCNELSIHDNIPSHQCFYSESLFIDLFAVPEDASKTGYRLPTSTEWKAFCALGSRDGSFLGSKFELAEEFAWMAENTKKTVMPVGLLLPNRHGLFDIFGNAFEVCTEIQEDNTSTNSRTEYLPHGMMVRQNRDMISENPGLSLAGSLMDPELPRSGNFLSTRIVRRLD